MGYVKETTGTAPNQIKLIRFYYKTDDIFNEASEITAFKASGVRKADGQADFDRIHISEDEKNHLKKHIKKGMLEIFSVMFKFMGESPMFHDTDVTVDTATFKASGALVKDNENGYREINLSLLDSKISDAAVDYVLQRWYWLKNMPDDSAMHVQRFNKLLIEINDLTLNLRTPKL